MSKDQRIQQLERQLEWFNNFADAVMGDRSTYDHACEYANEQEIEKYGQDYTGMYSSINNFVDYFDLEDKADEVFGEDWEAENDVEQIQMLVGGEYTVHAIIPTNEREKRMDDYIRVAKK